MLRDPKGGDRRRRDADLTRPIGANPASAAGRRDRLAHHGLALADVTFEREAGLLEHLAGAVVQERRRRLLAGANSFGNDTTSPPPC